MPYVPEDLLRAAELLTDFAGDVPFEPLWAPCGECGLHYETAKGHACPLRDDPMTPTDPRTLRVPPHLKADWLRARKELVRVPDELHPHYISARDRGLSHAAAVLNVKRRDAWRRREDEAQDCRSCGAPVLFRREKGHSVLINDQGDWHRCSQSRGDEPTRRTT